MMTRRLLLFLAIACYCYVGCRTALGATKDSPSYSFRGYFRGSLLIGPNGKMGFDPSEVLGSPMELTLFDEPYLELMGNYLYDEVWSLHTQVAIDNENLFHISGDPSNVDWVIRDFYLNKTCENQSRLWVGSRKYHRIEEHNFFGVGYENIPWQMMRLGIAYGARQDFGYYGGEWQEIKRNDKPLRETIIFDLTRPLGDGHSLQFVIEGQRLGRSHGISKNNIDYPLAATHGWSTGLSFYTKWQVSENYFAFTYSQGDFVAAALSRTNTQGSPTKIFDQAGGNPMDIGWYRQENARSTWFDVGQFSFSDTHQLGYKFAYISDQLKNGNKQMILYQLIPAINTSEEVKLAIDLSYTRLIAYQKPNLLVIAPQIILQDSPKNHHQMIVYWAYAKFSGKLQYAGQDLETTTLSGIRFDAAF